MNTISLYSTSIIKNLRLMILFKEMFFVSSQVRLCEIDITAFACRSSMLCWYSSIQYYDVSNSRPNQLTCKPLIFKVCQYYIYNTERKAHKSIIKKGTSLRVGVCGGGGGEA